MSDPDEVFGETPLDDISGLIPKHITTRAELNEAEASNILQALTKYLGGKPVHALAPFDLFWFYDLHAEMFGQVWTWAGRKRTGDLNLGVPHHQIEVGLQTLLDDLRYWERHAAAMTMMEQAARLHHRAVSIHPFYNGNGRWSRLLSNIWLAQHDHPVVLWPETTLGSVSTIRQAYLLAMRAADGGDLVPLVSLQHRYAAELPE